MPTRSPTTTALAATLRMSIARLNRRLRAERTQLNAEYAEVSLGALAVLSRLHREGPLSLGTLALREGVRPPSMSKIVDVLQEDGFVLRGPHPDDRRQVLVSATDRGIEVLLTDRRRREAWLARALTELTAQERALLVQAAPLLERLSMSGP